MMASVGVCTRPSETAPSNEERRRMVAARVAFMPTIQSASERDLAASRRAPRSALVAQLAEGLAHRLVGHRVQPQALDGLLGLHVLVDVGEDQLALAPRVARVDDLLDVVAAQLVAHDLHLLLGALVAHDELELARDDRQVGHPPLLELVVVLVGLGELDEVADGPGDDVLGALQPAGGLVPRSGVLLERTGQHAGEVLAHGRLLGDDEGLGHGRRRVAQPAHGPVDTELPATRSRSRLTTALGMP